MLDDDLFSNNQNIIDITPESISKELQNTLLSRVRNESVSDSDVDEVVRSLSKKYGVEPVSVSLKSFLKDLVYISKEDLQIQNLINDKIIKDSLHFVYQKALMINMKLIDKLLDQALQVESNDMAQLLTIIGQIFGQIQELSSYKDEYSQTNLDASLDRTLSMRNTVQVDSSIKQGDQTDLLNMLSYMRNRGKNDNNPG